MKTCPHCGGQLYYEQDLAGFVYRQCFQCSRIYYQEAPVARRDGVYNDRMGMNYGHGWHCIPKDTNYRKCRRVKSRLVKVM